jgi:hypothetical protein
VSELFEHLRELYLAVRDLRFAYSPAGLDSLPMPIAESRTLAGSRRDTLRAGFMSPDDDSENKNSTRQVLLVFSLVGVAVLLCLWLIPKSLGVSDDISLVNKSLAGRFQSTNERLGRWTLTPTRCLSGIERGMNGLVFVFGNGQPVEEIRVDTAREGDNVVEVRMADRQGSVYRVRERECKVIEGSITTTHITVNGEPIERLVGNMHFSCPAEGLEGTASFDGCIP